MGSYIVANTTLEYCLKNWALVMHLPVYESSLRAGHGWRGALYRRPGWFKKLLIVGDSAVRLLVTLGARSAW
jgi:hypothetical protein